MTQGEGTAGANKFEGKGPKLKDAIEDAWAKAKKSPNSPGTFRVEEIRVTGTNPIHEYRVILAP